MIPKYRAWDTVKKAMSEVQAVVYTEERVYPIYSKVIRRYIPFSEAVLMQSTGLFDVNGKEIFEGDVVKVHHFTENFSKNGGFYEGEEELIGIIEYGYPDYEVQNIGKVYPPRWGLKTNFNWLDFSNLYGIHEESFEVIGNIYENPELVEEAKNVDD